MQFVHQDYLVTNMRFVILLFCFLECVTCVWLQCPELCSCLDDSEHFNGGTVTNCSFINSQMLELVLSNISKLTNTLYLDNVYMDKFNKKWPPFQSLNQLYVRSAGLTNVSSFVNNLHNISTSFTLLDLSGNRIRHLDSTTFKQMYHLETLNLQGNKIQYLSKEVFQHLSNLVYLYLSNNIISTVEANSFSALNKVILLELTSNRLRWSENTTQVLNGLMSVTEIKLQNNSISGLHAGLFHESPKLQYLHLDNNNLKRIPVSSCMQLHKLTALYLANNQIQEVDMDLSNLTNIQYLYLTGNQISKVHPKSLDRIESLRAIWLNKNNLSGLAEDLSNLFYQINEINLLENPWKCDCHLVWLVRWFQRKTHLLSPTCNKPHPLVSWTNIKLSDMRCAIDSACTESKLQTSCAYCPPFEYLNQAGKCVCLDGYERPHHSSSCMACVDDTFSKSSAPCTKCENHSSTLSYASSTCSCEPGYTFNTQAKCTACPANTYKSKYGTYPCNPCPRYSISPVGSNSPSHCVCENSSSNKHSYRIQVCLPLISEPTDILVSTERQTATMMVQGRNDFQGPMLVGFATFFCCSIIITLLIVYIRRYGNYAFRRETPGDRGTETVTLSSADWLDGFAISKDGRYSKWDVPIRKLKIGRLLGKGAFGLVNEACAYGGSGFDNKTFKVAVKRLRDCASEDDISSLKQELEQMKLVGRHPNIISLYGFCHHKGQTMIIMELAELGDLLTYLKERAANSQSYVSISPEGDISEEETKQITEDRELMAFAWQVAKGMSHIESLKCIHRDLAARNVLLAQGPVAKISDFGLSRDVYENGYYLRVTKGRLPFKWLSPEALLWGQFSCKGDVWSYGMLLWEITTLGASPYPGIPADRMADFHRSGYRMPQPPNCPDQLYNIMRSCWDEDPRKRPTFAKLCDVMETILLGAIDRNYLEIQPNPLYSNEPCFNNELSDRELSLVALGSDEVLPCLQRFTDSPKYDGSSGYFSQTTGFYS